MPGFDLAVADADEVAIAFDGCRVVVRSPAPEVLEVVVRAFGALVRPAGSGTEGETVVGRLHVDRVPGGYRVAGPGVAPEEGPLEEARRAVRYHATRAIVEARSERLWIHAGAACRGEETLLVPGGRGLGKSTLVAALVHAGWQYLSDEAVPLDMVDDRAAPFPLTLQVRVGPASALAPEAVAGLAKRDVALAPSVIRRTPAPVTRIVFVRYRPGAPAALEPVPPGAAALELLESCLNFAHHGPRAVRYAADLTQRSPATRLTFSEAGAAVSLLERASGRAR